jgi:hypothetical protein
MPIVLTSFRAVDAWTHVEVEGDVLKCARLDIQHGELEIPPGALLSHSNHPGNQELTVSLTAVIPWSIVAVSASRRGCVRISSISLVDPPT